MYYGEIKNRQKVEVSCGDPTKLHLVLNLFRAPTPLERFRYASTIRWKHGTVIDKHRFKHAGKPCEYSVVVAFNDSLVKETTKSHRDGFGFLPVGYLNEYVEDIDYAWVHFNKDKESLRIRPVQNDVPTKDLSVINAALTSDSWVIPICTKDLDNWTDSELERFAEDFYCKHFGGTKESIKAYDIITTIRDIRTISDVPLI